MDGVKDSPFAIENVGRCFAASFVELVYLRLCDPVGARGLTAGPRVTSFHPYTYSDNCLVVSCQGYSFTWRFVRRTLRQESRENISREFRLFSSNVFCNLFCLLLVSYLLGRTPDLSCIVSFEFQCVVHRLIFAAVGSSLSDHHRQGGTVRRCKRRSATFVLQFF